MTAGAQVGGANINGIGGRKLPQQVGSVRVHYVYSGHCVHSIHWACRVNRSTPQMTD